MTEKQKAQKREYYLKNRDRIIQKNVERKRIKNGVIPGQMKNPWDNPEYREKMDVIRRQQPKSRFWLGKTFSEETKKKLSAIRKGRPCPWNKGRKHTEERKSQLSASMKGNQYSKGITHTVSIETRKKLSEARLGDKSPNWKGGLTSVQKQVRNSMDYRLWREAVFKRDNYTCVCCGARFIKGVTGRVILNADHIKSFSQFPELRLNIDNGRTLCYDCHRKTPTWGGITKFKKSECQV